MNIINQFKTWQRRSACKKNGIKIAAQPLRSSYYLTFEYGAELLNVKCVGRGCNLKIGADSYWRSGLAVGDISVGRFCSISTNVTIGLEKDGHPTDWLSTSPTQYSHRFLETRRRSKKLSYSPNLKITLINSDVWIGNDVTIMNGLEIGVGAIVASGSIVTKSVPAYAIVAGIPARIIKYRFNEDIIKELEASRWWLLELDIVANLPFSSIAESLEIINKYKKGDAMKYKEMFSNCEYGLFRVEGIKTST